MAKRAKSEVAYETNKDHELLKKVADGDVSAIEDFYHTYVDRLYSSVFNQVGRDHDVCQQVVQDTFLAAVKSAPRFQGKCRTYTWLYGIARRKVSDHFRNKYRVRQISFEPLDDNERVDKTGSESDDPTYESAEGNIIRLAMDGLPGHYREVLLLKYVDEMTMEEIGVVLNRSVKSVEGLLSRARIRLKKTLDRENEGLNRSNPTKGIK